MNTAVAKQNTPVANVQAKGLVEELAAKFGMQANPNKFYDSLKQVVLKGSDGPPTDEELLVALVICKKYDLDPFVKEIYLFRSNNKVSAVVSIDGWLKLINSKAQFDGLETVENQDSDGKVESITCTIHRKDRERPIVVTEYMAECKVGSKKTWQQWPNRMLRHKAIIQCARVAFSFSGIQDEDEGQMMSADAIDVTPKQAAQEQPKGGRNKVKAMLAKEKTIDVEPEPKQETEPAAEGS